MYGKFGKFHVQSTVILYFSSNTFDCAYYNAHLEIRDGTIFVVIGLSLVNLHFTYAINKCCKLTTKNRACLTTMSQPRDVRKATKDERGPRVSLLTCGSS